MIHFINCRWLFVKSDSCIYENVLGHGERYKAIGYRIYEQNYGVLAEEWDATTP